LSDLPARVLILKTIIRPPAGIFFKGDFVYYQVLYHSSSEPQHAAAVLSIHERRTRAQNPFVVPSDNRFADFYYCISNLKNSEQFPTVYTVLRGTCGDQ
jgi:hypothetical protein